MDESIDSVDVNLESKHEHIAIIGGGLVGLSVALSLLHCNQKTPTRLKQIVLIDPVHPTQIAANSIKSKTVAISYGSRIIYESLNFWHTIHHLAEPIKSVQVSIQNSCATTTLLASQSHVPALGYVIPDSDLIMALWRHLEADECFIMKQAELESIVFSGSQSTLKILENNKTLHLTADLVILANGNNTAFHKKLGFIPTCKSYKQTALVASLKHQYPHMGCAFEHFTPDGPIALLPCQSNTQTSSSLVWVMSTDQAGKKKQASDVQFLEQIPKQFTNQLGHFTQVEARQTFPVILSTHSEPVRPGLLLMGNADNTLHPVAGQSYNLALRHAMTLVSVLSQASSQYALGHLYHLNAYRNQQRMDTMRTIFFTDQLVKQAASTKKRSSRLLFSLGLFAAHHVPCLNHMISHYGMGLVGYGE
ncbi:MAG: hypothetical protein HAW62_05390 [Endozoicomonadaceae bacterium]|nr:hypothetical protein [Endozoicomonadaceae bacterium]